MNLSLSGVVEFASKVPKLAKSEVVIQLLDSYSNPVLSEQSKLTLEVASVNRSGFSTMMFVDNKDGTYTGSFLAKDVGTYEICASFDGQHFTPCPVGVNVYTSMSVDVWFIFGRTLSLVLVITGDNNYFPHSKYQCGA